MSNRVILAWSDPGMGKSTFALSGPGNKWYAEFDPGSYDRATEAMNPTELAAVDLHIYRPPPTELTNLGRLSGAMMGESGHGAVQVVHQYRGWREVYHQFISEYMAALEQDFEVYILDTSTMLWLMCRNAFRQRIQEEVPAAEQAERLKRLEYEEPNSHMAQLVMAAKHHRKTLVMLAHEGEVWRGGKGTGEPKPDGWGEAVSQSDVSLRFTIKDRLPIATVYKPEVIARGWEIEQPTIAKADQMLTALAAAKRMGFPPAQSYRELLESTEGL